MSFHLQRSIAALEWQSIHLILGGSFQPWSNYIVSLARVTLWSPQRLAIDLPRPRHRHNALFQECEARLEAAIGHRHEEKEKAA